MPKFSTSDGLSLYYTDQGDGLPILCLAGLTRTGADFQYVIPHLPNARIITMDYRGRGQSDWDPQWARYSVPVETRDVMELLDHLSISATAVLGTSRGGLVAMGMAAATPDRLLGAALNDIGFEINTAALSTIVAYLGINPLAKTHEEAAAALAHVLQGFDNVTPERWLNEARTHFKQTDTGLSITYDPKLRDAVAAGGSVPDLWPLLNGFAHKPLCLIRGAGSDLLTAATARKMQERRPDMIYAEVPDRGHVPFLDEPEALAALNSWIKAMQ